MEEQAKVKIVTPFNDWPTAQTITFGGRFISLGILSEITRIERSHISRILRGERQASVDAMRRLAKALGMDAQQFLNALDIHIKLVKIYGNRIPDKVSIEAHAQKIA